MYCTNCGNELTSNASFCAHCGKRVGTTSKTASKSTETRTSAQTATYAANIHEQTAPQAIARAPRSRSSKEEPHGKGQRSAGIEYFEASRQRDQHSQAAAAYQEIVDTYVGSLAACAIAGVLLAIVVRAVAGNGVGSAVFFYTASAFFFPFGFAPLYHWVSAHGFFVILNWIILIALAIITFFVAMIAAPIYICYAGWQIYTNRNAAQQEQRAAARYEAEIAALA